MSKKYIITTISTVDPSPSENIAAGYSLGQEWFNETTGEKFLHRADGEWVGASGGGIIEVTYDELVALKTGSLLVPKQTYLLTDYETTWDDPFISLSFSSGIIEPLYITATDVDELSNECTSKLYPQDIVYYEITGDIGNGEGTEGFTKGKIYRRIDTLKNNDIGTDWRHITYRRYAFNVTNDYVVGNSYVKGDVVVDNGAIFICLINDPNSTYTSLDSNWVEFIYDNGSVYSEKRSSLDSGIGISACGLSVSIPADPLDFEDLVMFPNYDNPMYEVYNNTIRTYKLHISIIYYNCKNNIIGDDFVRNTIHNINDCNLSREFANNNILNIINCNIGISSPGSGMTNNNMYSMDSNHIHGRFANNLTGRLNVFKWNYIDEEFKDNVIRGSFISNKVKRSFQSNNILSSTFYNTEIGVGFSDNTITSNVNLCKFGSDNYNFNITSDFTITKWYFDDVIDGSTLALPNLGEEYAKRVINANGTYIIEYIDEYGDDIIADQLETFVFRSNQENLNIIGGNNSQTVPLIIEWGDGSIWKGNGNSFNQTNTYSGKLNTDEYKVRIADSDLQYLEVSNNQLTYFDATNLPNTLNVLNLRYNSLTNFNPSIALPSSLQYLYLEGNQLTTFDPLQPLPSSLLSLELIYNQLTSFDPSIALPSSLINLFLQNNQLTSFDPSIALPSSLQYLYLNANQLTSFNPSIALPDSLSILYLQYNQLTSFDPSIALPNLLTAIELQSNQLTSFDPSIALPDSLMELALSSNQLTSFDPSIALPSSLYALIISYNQLTSFDPSIALPSFLVNLELQSNQLTSFDPSIALPGSLINLYLGTNLLTGFDPSIALPNSIQCLELHSNQLTSFNPSIALPSSLRVLRLYNNQLTSFDPSIALPNSLTAVQLMNNQLTSFNPSLPFPSSTIDISLNDNLLTGFDPSIALPNSTRYILLHNNQLTSFNPSIALPSSLEYLYLMNNQLTSFNPTLPLPSPLRYLNLNSNQLSTAEVNNTLVMLNTRYTSPGSKYFNLQMSPSAPPSGAGLTAKTALQAKGYSVYTN